MGHAVAQLVQQLFTKPHSEWFDSRFLLFGVLGQLLLLLL